MLVWCGSAAPVLTKLISSPDGKSLVKYGLDKSVDYVIVENVGLGLSANLSLFANQLRTKTFVLEYSNLTRLLFKSNCRMPLPSDQIGLLLVRVIPLNQFEQEKNKYPKHTLVEADEASTVDVTSLTLNSGFFLQHSRASCPSGSLKPYFDAAAQLWDGMR